MKSVGKIQRKSERLSFLNCLSILTLVGFVGMAPERGEAHEVQAHRSEEKPTLRVGMIEYDPLVIYHDKEPEGLVFEYARGILQNAGLPLSYHSVSVNRSIEQLKNHNLDMTLSLYKTREREKFIQFSKKPLLHLSNGFCTRVPIQQKPLTMASRLAYVRGIALPTALTGLVKFPVSGENTRQRMLQMMLKDRVDAVQSLMPELMILAAHTAKMELTQHCYEIKNSRKPIYFAFSKSLAGPIRRKLDEGLQKKLQEEDFDSFVKRRFVEAGIGQPKVQIIDPAQLP